MEIVIKLDQTEQDATKSLSELKEFFKGSEFEASLITRKIKSMSGCACNKYSLKLVKKHEHE